MRILVVGGTGFIGRHVTASLAASHDVAVFHRSQTQAPLPGTVTYIHGDRHDLAAHREALLGFAPEIVIDIVLGSTRQAQAAVDLFSGTARRLVAISSMDVYRACGVLHGLEDGPLEPLPLTEASALRTRTQTYPAEQVRMLQQVFGWLDEEYDKIPVERVVLGDSRIAGTVLRLPMVYGPGDPLHRQFPLIKRMDDGRRVIPFDERVGAWRSPRGYVENVAAAIALAAVSEHAAGRVYNVAERESLSEMEWARLVARAAGWPGEIVALPSAAAPAHLKMPGNLDQHWVADSTRIRSELGYEEPVSRDEALRRTIAWERAHPPATIDSARFDYAAEDAAVADS